MNPRRFAALAFLSGVALVAAACGGSGASSAPGATATAGAAATEQPAASNPGASQGLPDFSFVIPSLTADTELEAMFPDSIGGEHVTVISSSGSDFLGSGAAGNTFSPVLAQLGKSPADLSVAFGGTSTLLVGAFRLKGVPADQFLNAYVNQAQTEQATITDASFAGKSVKKIAVTGAGDVSYIYLHGDVVWTISGSGSGEPSADLLNEAFSKLP